VRIVAKNKILFVT